MMNMAQPLLPRLVRMHCALLLAGALLALAGCSDDQQASEQPQQDIDRAVQKTKDATIAAARKIAELAEKARDNTVAFFKSPEVKQDVAAAKEKLKDAGASLGSNTNDAALSASVRAAIARDPELSAGRIDVAAKAGAVRLSGSAPNAAAKSRAEQIARTVNGVDSVDNQLTVTAAN